MPLLLLPTPLVYEAVAARIGEKQVTVFRFRSLRDTKRVAERHFGDGTLDSMRAASSREARDTDRQAPDGELSHRISHNRVP